MTVDATAPVVAPAAVLWDMDGTLVDTEPYWMACEHELVDAFGGTWTEDDARSIIGFDLLDAAVVLRDRGGVDLEPHEIVERMLDGVIARVRERVPWRPGARRLLSELNELGVPCALVTMSWRRLVDAVVDELAPITFDAVVTGDDVRHGKPHPEPYLLAAERLGVDPPSASPSRTPRPAWRRRAPPDAWCSPCRTSCAIDPAPGRVIVPTPQGRRRRATSACSWPTAAAATASTARGTDRPAATDAPPPGGDHRRRRRRRARRRWRSASPRSAAATTHRRRARRAR